MNGLFDNFERQIEVNNRKIQLLFWYKWANKLCAVVSVRPYRAEEAYQEGDDEYAERVDFKEVQCVILSLLTINPNFMNICNICQQTTPPMTSCLINN